MTVDIMEEQRSRYLRRSNKYLPKSFLDDAEEREERTTAKGLPSTFLDDEDEETEEYAKSRYSRTGQRHESMRGRTQHSRASIGNTAKESVNDGLNDRTFFRDSEMSTMTGGKVSAAASREQSVEPNEIPTGNRSRSASIARSRSRYRKALPKIQTTTEEAVPAVPAVLSATTTPAQYKSFVLSKAPPMPQPEPTVPLVPLDVLHRQVNGQLAPAILKREQSSDSVASRLKTSSSDTSSSMSDGFGPTGQFSRAHESLGDASQNYQVLVVLSKRSREVYKFHGNTTAGELLDWACKKDAMTLRGAAILVERLPGFGFERAIHESELLHTIVSAMECRREEAKLYLDVDMVKSSNLRFQPATVGKAAPPRLIATFYHAKGENANVKIRSKRYFCLDDAKLVMSKRSIGSKVKPEKNSHICNLLDYGVYTVGQYGKKRNLDVPSKCQYIIIMKALAQKHLFEDQSRFFHFLATDNQEQYMEWIKILNEWRCFAFNGREKLKATEQLLLSKLDHENITIPDTSENKLARMLIETKVSAQARQTVPLTPVSPNIASPGFANPQMFQSLNDRPSTAEDSRAEFLPGGLLGAAYDRKVELRTIAAAKEIGNPALSHNKESLIHKASQRDDAGSMYNHRPPKTPVRESRSNSGPDSEPRGRRGQRHEDEMTFYREQTTSPQQRLRKIQSHTESIHNGMVTPITPGPLLNFDDEEENMFKFKRRNTGHGVDVDRNAGPLISHATQPVNPNTMSRSISTRMPSGSQHQPMGRKRSGTMTSTGARRTDEAAEAELELRGLLAALPSTQQQFTHGHGVATGRHDAPKPLMDMSLQSNFVKGSLLEQHEKQKQGGPTYKKAAIYREIY